ncbi:pseudouridine synthase [Tribonema minus]|uniref:tRNA pseudouridine synthase n=1 Tax=Tribonema minus TaxID=303371 RepID=A0A836C7W8_9STRA|nr:pseudouridine synthase [Tribonema minus]
MREARRRGGSGGAFDATGLGRAVNHALRQERHDVHLVDLELVPDAFHARHHAAGRTYVYRIVHPLWPAAAEGAGGPRNGGRSALSQEGTRGARDGSRSALSQNLLFERGRAWQVPVPLDLERVRAAAAALSGVHDFTSFRGAACVMKSPLRRIERFDVEARGPPVACGSSGGGGSGSGAPAWQSLTLSVRCRSFLNRQVRNMVGAFSAGAIRVRNMVGAIQQVGAGVMSLDELIALLHARDRSLAPPPAPPHGLYLQEVHYPPMEDILAAAALYAENRAAALQDGQLQGEAADTDDEEGCLSDRETAIRL